MITRNLRTTLASVALAGAAGCAYLTSAGGGTLDTVAGGATTVPTFERAVRSSLEKAGVTGLSVAVLNHGEIVYTKQFGWQNKDDSTSLNDSTVFAAGSLSKPLFAYLALTLAEQGVIDLDRPLQEYLDSCSTEQGAYSRLVGDGRFRRITGRMALSHTSGLPNLRAAHDSVRLEFDPGSRFGYSGEGIRLLQFAVECLTRQDVEALARRLLFGPYAMRHSSFVWQEAFESNAAAPHNEFEWPADPNRPISADAAGSLTTTASDYALFVAAILRGSRTQTPTVGMMLTPQVLITARRMFGDTSRAEARDDSVQLSWGLGWGLFGTPYGRAFFHTGNLAGMQSYAVAYPEPGIGIVLLSNSDNFQSIAREVVRAGIGDTHSPFSWLGFTPFEQLVRRPAPPRRIAIQVTSSVVAAYVGKYQSDDAQLVVFIKAEGNRLYASDDGTAWTEIHAESENVFFFRGRDVTLTFHRDATGTATRMDISLGRTTIPARRTW